VRAGCRALAEPSAKQTQRAKGDNVSRPSEQWDARGAGSARLFHGTPQRPSGANPQSS